MKIKKFGEKMFEQQDNKTPSTTNGNSIIEKLMEFGIYLTIDQMEEIHKLVSELPPNETFYD